MSWGTCYSGCNNIHFDFPPIMSDGRNFANWQPGGKINKTLRKENNIRSNNDYRRFLTNNADQIIQLNQQSAVNYIGTTCNKSNSSPNQPFIFKSCLDNSVPFGYENSDLKNIYLSRQQLQCRMLAPILSQEQYLQQQIPNPN